MKSHMVNHVETVRHHMFKEAMRTVQEHLNKMCKGLQVAMEEKADEIYLSMRRDYLKALGGEHVNTAVLSKEERAMRAAIRPILMDVDQKFKAILDGTIDDDEPTQPKSEECPEQETAGVPSEEADEMDVDGDVAGAASNDVGVEQVNHPHTVQPQTTSVEDGNRAQAQYSDEVQQDIPSSDEVNNTASSDEEFNTASSDGEYW
jgi:hypothetical protein